ncbi:MAG TPA: tetratricopeptide repeat protein [Vicinamibacterales bacterium]|nr:tetratricopeptide repeat protein [Vicinamibacterales bacterium]
MSPVRLLLAALSVLIALAGCASKTIVPAAPGVPRYPDFIFPASSADRSPDAPGAHGAAWQMLQSGDLRGAERAFTAVVRQGPQSHPAHTGLGYVALARKDHSEALAHFDRALALDRVYAPAHAGRGQTYLALDQRDLALASFDAALAADATLAGLRATADVLRFQGMQGSVGAARKAAEAGRLAEARAAYQQAIAASPQSPFLYRELATVERRDGLLDAALGHARRATEIEPTDARNFVALADVLEAQGQFAQAAEALATAVAIEPGDALTARVAALREKTAFEAMPGEYRLIDSAPTITRAQLAALIGVEVDDLLKRAPQRVAGVMTDVRGNWAAPWILNVARPGVMEKFPNHTFQPNGEVKRGDLAGAVSRVLNLIAAERPAIGAGWRTARRKFGDLGPGHLSYAAASVAVEAGIMAPLEDGTFQLTRPVTGAEAIAAVRKLRQLAGSRR